MVFFLLFFIPSIPYSALRDNAEIFRLATHGRLQKQVLSEVVLKYTSSVKLADLLRLARSSRVALAGFNNSAADGRQAAPYSQSSSSAAAAAGSRLRRAALSMSHKLPAYMRPSSSPAYHSINDEYNNGTALLASKKSKNTTPTRIAVILFLATFILICGRWVKSHPSFLEDIRIARTLAVNAHITLYPTIESYNVQTSQELPVPKVNASILGVPNTPKWKTIAAARIPAYPRKIVPGPSAPSTDEILFAIATTAERAISRAQWGLWPSFLTNPSSPCFVLLPPEDADRTTKVIAKLKEIGLNCIVKASQQKKYQIRVLALPREAMEAWQDRSNHIKWLIMGDE